MKKILQATTFTFGMMKFLMFTFIREILQVFRSIIVLNTVNMMNTLMWLNVSTKYFFHNKMRLSDIIMCILKRMIGAMNKNISSTFCNTAFPRRTFFSCITFFSATTQKNMLTFIPCNLTFFKMRSSSIHTYTFFIRQMHRFFSFKIFPIAEIRTIFSFRTIRIKFENFTTNNAIRSFHNILQKITAAFRSLMRKRLGFQTLLTADFGHKKFVPSLVTLSIAFLFLFVNNVNAIDDWKQGTGTAGVTGTQNVSDLDTTVASYIVDPLDKLLTNYRTGCQLAYTSATTVTVQIGEIVCSNSGGTARRFRKNTSTTTVVMTTAGVGGLDAGAEAAGTRYYIYAVADADATTFTAICSTNAATPTGITYFRYLGSFYNNASSNIDEASVVGAGAGRFVQQVNTPTVAMAVCTTAMPYDDSIPSSSEGAAISALDTTIIPRSTTNKLLIRAVINCGAGSDQLEPYALALYQDAGASAIAVSSRCLVNNAQTDQIILEYPMTSGTTSATTFKLRIGNADGGAFTINGSSGARYYGGVLISSLTITETES